MKIEQARELANNIVNENLENSRKYGNNGRVNYAYTVGALRVELMEALLGIHAAQLANSDTQKEG